MSAQARISSLDGVHEIIKEKEKIIKEESAEEFIMQKELFENMKKWYNNNEKIKEQFGDFPVFIQDLKIWKNYEEVFKIYNAHISENSPLIEIEYGPHGKKRTGWGLALDIINSKKMRFNMSSSKLLEGVGACVANGLIEPKHQEILNHRILIEELNGEIKEIENNNNNNSNINNNNRSLSIINQEKRNTVNELIRLNPLVIYGYNHCKTVSKKIYIPIKENPNFNYMGLLIGPRGKTQKAMESESGCRINIRGRGCMNGKRYRNNNNNDSIFTNNNSMYLNNNDYNDDNLHVLIQGESEEAIKKATDLVNFLLFPEDKNKVKEHKMKQLRELAKINGTLYYENNICNLCGTKGHTEFECPNNVNNNENNNKKVEIRCSICGNNSHISGDCKFKYSNNNNNNNNNNVRDDDDKEYYEFMKELGVENSENDNKNDDSNNVIDIINKVDNTNEIYINENIEEERIPSFAKNFLL